MTPVSLQAFPALLALAAERGHAFSQSSLLPHQASGLGESEHEQRARLDPSGQALLPCFGVTAVD